MKKIKQKVEKKIVVSGKRKTSIANAVIQPGTGIVRINKKPIALFNFFHKLYLQEPFKIAEDIVKDEINKVDIDVVTSGGGIEGQVEASRLAIARALVAFFKTSELRNAFARYDKMLLVADTRRKETRKPNDSKARAARQKSYR